jgi:hypothetical protein
MASRELSRVTANLFESAERFFNVPKQRMSFRPWN